MATSFGTPCVTDQEGQVHVGDLLDQGQEPPVVRAQTPRLGQASGAEVRRRGLAAAADRQHPGGMMASPAAKAAGGPGTTPLHQDHGPPDKRPRRAQPSPESLQASLHPSPVHAFHGGRYHKRQHLYHHSPKRKAKNGRRRLHAPRPRRETGRVAGGGRLPIPRPYPNLIHAHVLTRVGMDFIGRPPAASLLEGGTATLLREAVR